MEASALFESETKLISLDERNCQVGRDQKEVTCTTVKSCLTYNGINLPPTIGNYYLFLLKFVYKNYI